MKLIGAIILIISTTLVGLLLSKSGREKIVVCEEILELCSAVKVDMLSSVKPIKSIIDGGNYRYFSVDNIVQNKAINSSLTDEENDRIGSFIYSLGKTNIYAQGARIKAFEEYIKEIKTKYEREYLTKSRIYISFGISSGVVMSLVLI